MTAAKSLEESQQVKGEGIETLKNEPYSQSGETGQYTYKVFHFKSRIPAFMRWALPDKYCHLHEKSWVSYPHYHTVYENPGIGKNFSMEIDSWHVPYKHGEGIPDNLLNLSPDELKERRIVYLDILNGKPKPEKNQDLGKWTCPALNVNKPLSDYLKPKSHGIGEKDERKSPPEWTVNYDGEMMVAVKVVKINFNWKGLQQIVEKYATHTLLQNLFVEAHREMMRWGDKWGPMSLEDVQKYEKKIYSDTNALGFENDQDKPTDDIPEERPEDLSDPEISESVEQEPMNP